MELLQIDPATLEAGPELRSLVSEIISGPWDETRCRICGWTLADDVLNGCVPGNCSLRPPPEQHADEPGPYDTSPGLAFEVLWPWLKKELGDDHNLWIGNDGHGGTVMTDDCWFGHGILSVQADTDALALCRAVIAVAKERSR